MILIIESPDGELSGAFAVQQGREACESRLPGISAVIESDGTKILEGACIEGDWQFSKFMHSYEDGAEAQERHTYLVRFDDDGTPSMTVVPQSGMEQCNAALADGGDQPRSYCVTSRQSLQRE